MPKALQWGLRSRSALSSLSYSILPAVSNPKGGENLLSKTSIRNVYSVVNANFSHSKLFLNSDGIDYVKCYLHYLYDASKIDSFGLIICLDEYFSQHTLPNRIVFAVELVESVKRVPILKHTKFQLSIQLLACQWSSYSVEMGIPRVRPACPH